MRLYRVLLVTLAALLASTDALSAKLSTISTGGLPAAALSGHLPVAGSNGPNNGRSLRIGTSSKEQVVDEERAGLLAIGKYAKVRWWLEAEKSDDFVMQALKLKGLEGKDLTSHKNYKYYKYFAKKSEDYLLNGWLKKEVSTYQAWEKMGLTGFRTVDELKAAKKTDAFRVYARYVNELDDNVLYSMKKGYNPPAVMVSRGATEAEMRARIEIMAQADRSDAYAKLALGLTVAQKPMETLKGTALTTHADYIKYFTFFEQEKARLRAAGQLQKRRSK